MSRVAKNPITLPKGVEFKLDKGLVQIKGGKGSLQHKLSKQVEVKLDDNVLTFTPSDHSQQADALAGTTRALLNNMIHGVSRGFERKLTLVGVGYRAQVQGKALNLTLGFSHPVSFPIPEGIHIETPSQTEILVKGIDKALVGQVSANIRAYRPPEPYKGKGVRYADEVVVQKEAKKK
jgi:large subunit ribosomal protein L6